MDSVKVVVVGGGGWWIWRMVGGGMNMERGWGEGG